VNADIPKGLEKTGVRCARKATVAGIGPALHTSQSYDPNPAKAATPFGKELLIPLAHLAFRLVA